MMSRARPQHRSIGINWQLCKAHGGARLPIDGGGSRILVPRIYPRFLGGAGLLAWLQGARTRYLCLFEPGWVHPPCRSMMMYSSRDPVGAANVITWLCPDLTPPGLTKHSRQERCSRHGHGSGQAGGWVVCPSYA